ncbi:UDP-N-acetylmuramoyl-tripeptide--D-alanyl-D-alanine ligase [Coraliomargarita akajimensis]|uniref:UDP-N-acetylmuramoyl-tripeptide--D-alanyl-D-alanine ligase n=1 Tax=Coraliomargarita akajimensis (strain DSM 45221 / IAM 15411 / JCM 23193 / KCTC 12865 / 04OKA010-24) TaxID=583355 RepID=D5EI40_CORAD|nr:UDP-N-acetylmuramoyl-tripeptide--D-alanyl-D-alanine ligase [Coraliomargarita akajimensis]ADE56080.1 UDP-N-acetylmuramoylalanyl-D-glutamyl-2,6-diaminopimelate/D-alanyl-D-alanyl ligase [Coraliomargarita akajimensis DSM 45221]
MSSWDPSQLADWTNGHWLGAHEPEAIRAFCFDTRQLQSGDCFIALTAGARDGHDFVEQALAAGAGSALVSRPLDLPIPQLVVEDTLLAMEAIGAAVRAAFSGPVVGVTGSCGKTSTKEMLRLVLGESVAHATAGNWNNRIGVPMTLFGLDSERQEFAVIEAGINQPGEMNHLGEMIAADVVVVTAIEAAHLELLQTVETIANEKSQLMAHARPSALLILPAELLNYAAFNRYRARAVAVVEAGSPVPEGVLSTVSYRFEGPRIVLSGEYFAAVGGRCEFQLASQSRGIRRNAALAMVTAAVLGQPTKVSRVGIENWQPSGDRGRLIESAGRQFYVDCYNANPASMADALDAFAHSVPDEVPRCYVLGAMNELGADAPRLHRESIEGHDFRPQDRVYLVGPQALLAGYAQALEKAGSQLSFGEKVENFESEIADFKGALFLKGSRSYRLEQLLPEALR